MNFKKMASALTLSLAFLAIPFAANGQTSDPIDILRASENPSLTVESFSPAQKQQVLNFINSHSESEVAVLFKQPTSHFRSSEYGGYLSSARERAACLVQVGYSGCNKAKEDANIASNTAWRYYSRPSQHNGKGDAFRHAYWNARMVHSIGERNAKIIADNHEYYKPSTNPAEDRMDYANNATGRWIGKTYAFSMIETICKRYADMGWLVTLK